MPTKINSLIEYKKAKLALEDMERIIPILTTYLYTLDKHKKYIPISEIISSIKINKKILEYAQTRFKKIVEDKGKI